MAQTLLATRQITKRYGSSVAVDGVSLTLQEGQIYGLVGQNGAGKTTLMRMMTGQTLPSSGELELFGETSPQGIDRMRANLGAVVETPSFFPFFTARENLEYYRRQRGIVGRGCIDDALRQVELGDTGSKKFKDFSLGMKQRLGLALALLNRPAMPRTPGGFTRRLSGWRSRSTALIRWGSRIFAPSFKSCARRTG